MSRLSEYTVQAILRAFRVSALSNAVREEMIPKNVASLVRVSKPRKSRKVKPWTVGRGAAVPSVGPGS